MNPVGDDGKYRALFLEESHELLDGFLNGLFELQRTPDDPGIVDELFRVTHTLKGMAGAMGYGTVADFCHRAESYLDRWRKERTSIRADDLDFMFHVEAALRDMTANPEDVASHQEALAIFAAEGGSVGDGEASATPVPTRFEPPEAGETGVIVVLEDEVAYPRLRFKMVLGRLEKHASSVRVVPPMEMWDRLDAGTSVAFYLRSDEPEGALLQAAASVGEVALVTVVDSTPEPAERGAARSVCPTPAVPSFQQTGIRVERRKLDQITNMVGEILLARGRLRAVAGRHEDPELDELLEQIEQTTLDLERLVLSARMVPVGSIFQRFQRLVHELAKQLGKEVDAEFVGGETEIDRSLLERVSEPLVHILRNSLDHGIEAPDERVAAGKPRRGRLRVVAAMEHGNVALKVEDDGRGIDATLVLEAARRQGLVPDDEKELTRAQVFSLLFRPGFSTSGRVTDVSGRGVGLDVVRQKVAEVGGDLNMISEQGQFTKMILEFPPTLSLMRSVVVGADDSVIGVPQNQVHRIMRLEPGDISWVKDTPVVISDARPVMVRSLAALLGKDDTTPVDEAPWVLLVRSSSRLEALAIDRLVGDQELVIKPLMPSLAHSPGIVGTTLLSDGRLALFADLRLLLLHHDETAQTRSR